MKFERKDKPPFIIGGRILIGQALLGALNTAVVLFNYFNPENKIDAAIAGYMAQPIIFIVQVWYVNRFGVTQ